MGDKKEVGELYSEVMVLRHQMNSLITTLNGLVQALDTLRRILNDREQPTKKPRVKVLKHDLN